MARSTRIYVVGDAEYDGFTVEAAFTVKREACGWLRRRREENPLARWLYILSLPDDPTNLTGKRSETHEYTEKEFMEA